tara:strand:+ start:163 stop:594 length:432 start_codon:yes stop_codon:yes gene_type:complete
MNNIKHIIDDEEEEKRKRKNKQRKVGQTIYWENLGIDCFSPDYGDNKDILLDEYNDTVDYVQNLAGRNSMLSFDNTDVINFPDSNSLQRLKTSRLIDYYEKLGFKNVKIKVGKDRYVGGKKKGQQGRELKLPPIGKMQPNSRS